MNPKVIKLKEERKKNCDKIASLQARNKKIEEDIVSLENTDIIGMIRSSDLTIEEIVELISSAKATKGGN